MNHSENIKYQIIIWSQIGHCYFFHECYFLLSEHVLKVYQSKNERKIDWETDLTSLNDRKQDQRRPNRQWRQIHMQIKPVPCLCGCGCSKTLPVCRKVSVMTIPGQAIETLPKFLISILALFHLRDECQPRVFSHNVLACSVQPFIFSNIPRVPEKPLESVCKMNVLIYLSVLHC